MAGEIQLNGTTALTESSGAITLNNVNSATNRTNLGLGSAATSAVGDFASNTNLSDHAAVTSGVHGISSYGATLVDDANAATARTTLGLGSMATETASGFIKNVQVFSSSGTYTKTTGVNDVFVMVYGGSGGGGGSNSGNGGAGGTSSFGAYCSASGGSGGVGGGGQSQNQLGAANGSGSGGNVNSNSTVGGAAGNRYVGGSARDIGQYGGAGGFACELITGVTSTVSVTVGSAGTFGNDPTYKDGNAGAAGYVIVFELL